MASNQQAYETSNTSRGASPIPGANNTLEPETEQEKFTPIHWVTRDWEHILYIANKVQYCQLYTVGHDDAVEGKHDAHYHVFFGLNEKKKPKKKLFRDLRRSFGCKPEEHKNDKEAQEKAKACKHRETGDHCPNCGFYIKTTKPINSPLHARNVFDYIRIKKGAIATAEYDFGPIDEQAESMPIESDEDFDHYSSDEYTEGSESN